MAPPDVRERPHIRFAVHCRVTVSARIVPVIVSPSSVAGNSTVTPKRFADRLIDCPLIVPVTGKSPPSELITPVRISPFCSSVSVHVCVPPFRFRILISHLPAMPIVEVEDGAARVAPCGLNIGLASGSSRVLQNFICTTRAITRTHVIATTSFSRRTSHSKYSLIYDRFGSLILRLNSSEPPRISAVGSSGGLGGVPWPARQSVFTSGAGNQPHDAIA